MFNHFGFDRAAFRRSRLLPVSAPPHPAGREPCLAAGRDGDVALYLGLAIAPGSLQIGGVDVLAAGLKFVGAFVALGVLGNVASILVPYRIAAGSLRRRGERPDRNWLIFLTHLADSAGGRTGLSVPALGLLLDQTLGPPVGAVATPLGAVGPAVGAALSGESPPLGRPFEHAQTHLLQW